MITVDKKDGLSLKISHIVDESKQQTLEIFLFVPGELGLSPDILKESDFYYNSISSHRTYFSNQNHLPLVHSRLAQRGRLSSEQYRLSLSLYAYQYALALEKSSADLTKDDQEEITIEEFEEVISLALDILKRLRRSVPYEDQLKRYYANIDNYLSWYTEQKFLSLVAHLPRSKSNADIRNRLIEICEKEHNYRIDKSYNSQKARADLTRMSNKMRLSRRLIEYPIVLKERTNAMGNNVKRMVKGSATAFVMLFVSLMIIQARGLLGEITVSFIFAISFIYAIREIFKDDLRDALWRWIQKGKPKWRKIYSDPTSGKQIGRKIEWLEYQSFSNLAKDVQAIRKRRVSQREEVILHYKSQTKMAITKFMSGYEQTRESMNVDLRPLSRLMEKGSQKIYLLNEGQVSKEAVEKRHLINLVIKETTDDKNVELYRWKIIVNRSKIVDIEQIFPKA